MRPKSLLVASDAQNVRLFVAALAFEDVFEFGTRVRVVRPLREAMDLHSEDRVLEKRLRRIVVLIGVLHRVERAKVAGGVIEARCADRGSLTRLAFRRCFDDIEKRSMQRFRVVDKLDQLVVRPCGQGCSAADESACKVASLHCRYDFAVLSDDACVKRLEYGDEVDIAFIAGFASCAASLYSCKHEMVAEVRLEFFQERFAPLFGIYHGFSPFLYAMAHVGFSERKRLPGKPRPRIFRSSARAV